MSTDDGNDGAADEEAGVIRRPHHKRFVLLADLFEEEGTTETEPEHREVRRPDMRFEAHVQPAILKPLHHLTRDRVILIEHFSSASLTTSAAGIWPGWRFHLIRRQVTTRSIWVSFWIPITATKRSRKSGS